ncbi:MAG: DUF732 domain-containing protein [Actinomycetota bacterium]|nr:DUF732 domain-containing protein [Actinomycetota bacterium]
MSARVARLAAAVVLVAACGDAAAPETTADPMVASASDYAFSARRAIEGTRFEGLGDDEVAALVIELCDDLAASSDPDAEVLAFLEGVDAPPGEAVDDRIMAVVLAEGALTVCPAAVDAAAARAWEVADPEVRYLAAVAAVAPELDEDLTGDDLVAAGRAVCSVLDGGGSPEEAVVAEFAELFGISGVSMDEIASGAAGEREGMLVGGVLGGAASFLCPRHRDAVAAYLEVLAEENAG